MYLRKLDGPRVVALPNGQTLSLADLPGTNEQRWVASRKALVVQAVVHGLISADEARRRWRLSQEELARWLDASQRDGPKGLKAARLQERRHG